MRRRVDRQCRCGAVIAFCFNVCSDCSARRIFRARYLSGANLAHSAVARARARGDLDDPKLASCMDCGGAAAEYDHRDYNEPLKVDAVCRRCNLLRGTAIPKRWAPGEWDQYLLRVAAQNQKHKAFVVRLAARFADEILLRIPQREAAA